MEDKPASTMRKEWFNFVRKTRTKMSRASKTNVSHREAMKAASAEWPKEKLKVLKRLKREAKREARKLKEAER